MENQWDTESYINKHDFVYRYGSDLLAWKEWVAGEHVLDLGCGTGQLTQAIHKKGCSVLGMDASMAMVEEARKNYPNLTFVLGDATDFDLKVKVDTIFSNAVLHWIRPPEKAIACMFNVLNPGGELLVEFGGKDNVRCMLDALYAVMASRGYPIPSIERQWYFPSIGE